VIQASKVRTVSLDQKGQRVLMAHHSMMHLMMVNFMEERKLTVGWAGLKFQCQRAALWMSLQALQT